METLEEHLKTRHLDTTLHNPSLDEESRVVTFYLYNLSGQLVGYQTYRPDASKAVHNDPRLGRYFTYKTKGQVGVWGVESLHLTPHVVFVTEGVFDAARLTKLGVSALAMLSNDPDSSSRNFVSSLGRTVVVVADNDKAGRKLASLGDFVVYTLGKDLGEADEDFVQNLVDTFCYN